MPDVTFRLVKRLDTRPVELLKPGEGDDQSADLERNHVPDDDTPDTPLDEPKPPRIEDPPASGTKSPFVAARRGSHETPYTEDRTVNTERKERRGFASMSPEKQREIASKGGRAAHEKGTAHEWTADEARSAGRKGGQVSRGGRGRLVEPPMPASEPMPPINSGSQWNPETASNRPADGDESIR
jgi:general stress protein YciG